MCQRVCISKASGKGLYVCVFHMNVEKVKEIFLENIASINPIICKMPSCHILISFNLKPNKNCNCIFVDNRISFNKQSYENVFNELYYLHKTSFSDMSHNIPSEACGYLICMDRWEN